MPKKNAIKVYGVGEYYHVYNRGVAKMDIFREEGDYIHFLSLLKKYLSPENVVGKDGRQIPNYVEAVDLVAFCLMPNHYHMMIYLKETSGLEKLMRSVMTAYSMYFNKKYKRTGGVFEGRFLAARVSTDQYFWQVSRYIHLNPLDIKQDYLTYSYSSLPYFKGEWQSEWVHPEHQVNTAEERREYLDELAAQQNVHEEYHNLKKLLALTEND